MSIRFFNSFTAVLALIALAAAIAIFASKSLREAVRERAVWGGSLVALVATLGSLTYSEYFLFEPCRLCWFQRIAMYPLVLILGVGAWKRDRNVGWYALPLAGIGLLISIYHYVIQTFPDLEGAECVLGVSCNAKYVNEFGFVSIPLMAGCGFLLIIALVGFARKETE